MNKTMKVANEADIIVNGYAFTKDGGNIKVLNLNKPWKAAYITNNNEVLETSMNDIELDIVKDYFRRNRKYMEE